MKIFNEYPELKKYYRTSDGTPFFKEHIAKSHASSLEDKKVETIFRSKEEKKAKSALKSIPKTEEKNNQPPTKKQVPDTLDELKQQLGLDKNNTEGAPEKEIDKKADNQKTSEKTPQTSDKGDKKTKAEETKKVN